MATVIKSSDMPVQMLVQMSLTISKEGSIFGRLPDHSIQGTEAPKGWVSIIRNLSSAKTHPTSAVADCRTSRGFVGG